MKEDIKHLAEKISFKLLATKNHKDFDWLVEELYKIKNNERRD